MRNLSEMEIWCSKFGDLFFCKPYVGISLYQQSENKLIQDRGGWLSDPLNEHVWGRRGALFVASLISLASSIGSGYVSTWQVMCSL